MAVKGVFASDSGIQGGKNGDFADALLMTQPTGSAPMLALSSGMSSADAQDVVVTWFEENHMAGRVSITNNAASGTTIIVADASQIVQGAILLIETTGEYIFVEAVSGLTLTVTRGLGGSTISAIDGSSTAVPAQKVGTAHEEGSPKPVAIANLGFPVFNYVQIFRNAWDVTGTASAVSYRTGDIMAKNKMDAGILHAEDIEKSILFGIQAIATQNGRPFRTMNGITKQLITNVQAQGANITWDILNAFLQKIFEKNIKGKPNERIAFCGNGVITVINKLAQINGTIDIKIGETEFGLKVNKWLTPYGDVTLMTHPLMTESPLWTKDLLVLHPGAIRTRWLRRTFEDDNSSNGTRNGVDADFGTITSEMCIEYKAQQTGGYFTGIDTAA